MDKIVSTSAVVTHAGAACPCRGAVPAGRGTVRTGKEMGDRGGAPAGRGAGTGKEMGAAPAGTGKEIGAGRAMEERASRKNKGISWTTNARKHLQVANSGRQTDSI